MEQKTHDLLNSIFLELDEVMACENKVRHKSSSRTISKAKITVLGQISLMAQPELTLQLDLVRTGDLDAKISGEHFVKKSLINILPKYKLIYDEDSDLIFIPRGSTFKSFGKYEFLDVEIIDPESALVSKAVKAPQKNKQLIRAAISSGNFKKLASRIVSEGGDLNHFL